MTVGKTSIPVKLIAAADPVQQTQGVEDNNRPVVTIDGSFIGSGRWIFAIGKASEWGGISQRAFKSSFTTANNDE